MTGADFRGRMSAWDLEATWVSSNGSSKVLEVAVTEVFDIRIEVGRDLVRVLWRR